MTSWKRSLLQATLLFTLTGSLLCQTKVAPEIQSVADSSLIDVVVRFNKTPDDGVLAQVSKKTGLPKKVFPKTKAVLVNVVGRTARELASEADVEYVSTDRELRSYLDYSATATNAAMAWSYGYSGAGVGVAIIDSGIDRDAADLLPRIGGLTNLLPDRADAEDTYGHGTHVAGIIAGSGANSRGSGFKATFQGMAPAATLHIFRVLDAQGRGKDSDVIDAIEKIMDHNEKMELKGKSKPIRVINLSLGRPIYESFTADPLCRAVQAAWESGIVVVVAAGNYGRENSQGNDGYGTITAPGNHPFVITVGAMNTKKTASRSDDVMASYSSKGPTFLDHVVKPDLVAPGNLIASVDAKDARLNKTYPGNRVLESDFKVGGKSTGSDKYLRLSGTSMASGMVSGAVALLLEKQPNLTPDQVKAQLMKTAYKTFPASSLSTDPVTGQTYWSQYDILTIGAGYLDVSAAITGNEVAPIGKLALSPRVVYDPQTGSVSLITDYSAVWGVQRCGGVPRCGARPQFGAHLCL